MIVVADSSPIIFLGKLGQHELLKALYPENLVIPTQIRDELLHPSARGDQIFILSRFVDTCTVLPVPHPKRFAAALSVADNAVLTLALGEKAERIVADERLLRRIAQAEGISVIGTIGLIHAAVFRGIVSGVEAKSLLGRLVRECDFRISIDVYERALAALETATHS